VICLAVMCHNEAPAGYRFCREHFKKEVELTNMAAIADVEKVDHPKHYNSNPSGVECIDVVEHMNFNVGNAIKYLWRADEKGAPIEDLKKARWYIDREIQRREKAK